MSISIHVTEAFQHGFVLALPIGFVLGSITMYLDRRNIERKKKSQ